MNYFGQWRAVLITLMVFGAFISQAEATEVKVIVNDEIITTNEIATRAKLIQLFSKSRNKAKNARKATDELIEEALIRQAAGRSNVTIERDIALSQFASIASRNRMSPAQFRQVIKRSGASPKAFIDRIHAALLWQKFAGTAIRNSVEVSEQDIAAQIFESGETDNQASQIYRLASVLLVLPKDPSKRIINKKLKDADRIRRSINGCDNLGSNRNLEDVVVKEIVTRRATDLSEEAAEILNKTKIGRAIPGRYAGDSIEILVLCDREEVTTTAKVFADVRKELVNGATVKKMRKVLYDIKRAAVIIYR